MLTFLLGFAVSLVVAVALTPAVRRFATGRGLLDEPGGRKIHPNPVPRLGGIAIVAGFFIGLGVALFLAPTLEGKRLGGGISPGFLIGGALIALVGLTDDVVDLPAIAKFGAQVLVGVAAFALGLSVTALSVPWGRFELGIWALPVTVLWIAAVINAINLIDGLDGLAAGVALTVLAAFAAIAAINALGSIVLVAAALAGGTLAFLFYNRHPATIIMGDAGSMFLGFLLAGLAIELTQQGGPGVPAYVPIVALGVPLADTLWAVVRRFIVGRPVFTADQQHVHHRLLRAGLSQPAAVLLLCAASAVLGAGALLLSGVG